ncbi:hypothetical protein SRHO_G00262260 [Serrasalmus rhombeus]
MGPINNSTSGHTQFSSLGHTSFTTSSALFITSVGSIYFFILDFTLDYTHFILAWVHFSTLDPNHFSILGLVHFCIPSLPLHPGLHPPLHPGIGPLLLLRLGFSSLTSQMSSILVLLGVLRGARPPIFSVVFLKLYWVHKIPFSESTDMRFLSFVHCACISEKMRSTFALWAAALEPALTGPDLPIPAARSCLNVWICSVSKMQ